MPYLMKKRLTVTRSTSAALSTNFGGWINGQIHSIQQSPTTKPSKLSVITIGRGSTLDVVLKFALTTTLVTFYPRVGPNNSTGKAYAASTEAIHGIMVPFTTQEISVNVKAASSANHRNIILDVYYMPSQ